MKSFLNYSKNRFLYGLIKFGFLLFALYVGYSLFGCIQVHALTPTINKQAYYYHANEITQTNSYCITSADNPSCSTTESTGSSPWLTGTDLSFQTQINAGKFSGSAIIYLHVVTPTSSTFFNRGIDSSNVNIGIGIDNVEFPENNANVSDIEITNFKIENITDTVDALGNYVSKVTFDYTGYTNLSGSYYVKIGVGAKAGTDGLFQQLNGNAWESTRLTFTALSNSPYKSVLVFNSGSQTDQKLDDLNESIQQGNEELKDSIDNAKDEINDTIKDSFEDCRDSYNLFNYNDSTKILNAYIASDTRRIVAYSNNRTIFIPVESGKTYTITKFIGGSNLVISTSPDVPALGGTIYNYKSNGMKTTVTIPEGQNYLIVFAVGSTDLSLGYSYTDVLSNLQIQLGSVSTEFEPYGKEVCQNRLDETNDQLGNLNDNITDSTPPNLDGLADSAGWLPAGPVDSILNLPISLLNNLNDNLGGTCQPANLTLPFINQNITLPCMSDVYKKIGISGWVNTVGTIAAAFIGYYYLLELYKWVDNVLTMRENQWNDVDQWGGI